MKKTFSKFLALLLAISMLFTFCACDNNASEQKEPKENQILDASGRIIDLPKDPKTATAASVYAVASPFFTALKISNRVKAVNVKKAFWKKADEGFKDAGNVGNGVVDLEKLAKYNPTALIHRSNDPDTVKAVSKLKIDVICITVENMDDVKTTLNMLGKYFGADQQAKIACEWIDSKFALIDSIVAKIPKEERKTALLMGGELGRIAGNDMLQSWMIEKAGGIPVADTGKDHNWVTVGVEKVFEYNPEYIFCTSSTARDYTTEEILESKAWSAVNAVKDNNIYIVPCKEDSWDMPGLSAVLGTMYMLKTMYPEYLSEEDFIKEVDEYYNFMFGKSFELNELGYIQ